jgi:hypothetical protein
MINEKPSADFGAGMDLNACEPTAKVGNQTGRGKPSPLIEGVSNAVEPDCMETRITEENLHRVFRRRVSVFDGPNVFL